ncbi:MAG TPA: HEAT repeat domain-containing protein [Pyrinomonadaceae bacterium]|nr:HEAT repeat domain-containing protein [Pyrinomonadaceae bacterium]
MENEVLNRNGTNSPAATPAPKRRPSNWWLIVVAALFIIVPFLTWYGTWFGRALSDEKITEYLADESKPRHIQHALTQIEARIEKRDQNVKKFYPRIIELSRSSSAEVRKTAAWVMGQDNKSEEFRQAIIALLKDSEPIVRRNAALQLVRFNDASGRPELRAMLQPFEVKSPIAGTLISLLPQGSPIRTGSLLARIRDTTGNVQEFRAPVSGKIGPTPGTSAPAAKEGDAVTVNQTIAWLAPDRATISEALRALAYVGTKEDLALIQQAAQADGSSDTAQEASMAAKSIESRANSVR